MGSRWNRATTWIVVAILAAAGLAETGRPADPDRERRLGSIRTQIGRLERELASLEGKARGVIGELERMGAELRLREAQLAEVSVRLREVSGAIDDRERNLAALKVAQEDRRRYLSFRVREMYKQGPALTVRRVVAGDEDVRSFLAGLRYAEYLGERDTRLLEEFRVDADRLQVERGKLVGEKDALTAVRREASAARGNLRRSRADRERMLDTLQKDQDRRRVALQELEEASAELTGLVDRLADETDAPRLAMEKFRGLLDWPAAGRVRNGFGEVVHPRFKTVVPHPGLDIEAPEGADFHTVFDGRVVYASWLRGYGLTVIVDHGGGLMSVYAHASVLLVEEQEDVLRGQRLGKVGETGSLRGPYLYFELRRQREPVDPAGWLRKR